MNKHEKFMTFIESFRTSESTYTIDIITEAYEVCHQNVIVEGAIQNVIIGLTMLANVANAASKKEVMPEVNKVIGAITQLAKHSTAGGYNTSIPELTAKLNKTIMDVVDDKEDARELTQEVSAYVNDEIMPMQGSASNTKLSGKKADYPIVSGIKKSQEEAKAELLAYAREYGVEPTEIAFGSVPVKKTGMFGGQEQQVFAYDPTTVTEEMAYKNAVQRGTRQLGEKYFKR